MFAVWLLPTNEDVSYLSEIVKKLSKAYDAPEFLPHITVYGLVNTDSRVIKDAVRKSITNLKPFMVRTAGISYSDYIWKSVFINIELNSDLVLINEKLSHKLAKYSTYEFSPHISLIYKNMDEFEKKKLIEGIEQKNQLVIDKIAILKFSENIHQWKIVETLKLN